MIPTRISEPKRFAGISFGTEKKYEFRNGDGPNVFFIQNTYWYGQTFTVGNTGANEEHKITKVSLNFAKRNGGTDGTFDVVIKAVDGSDLPTGPVLSSGSINMSDISTSYAEIIIPISSYILLPNTKYVMIFSCLSSSVRSSSDFGSQYLGGKAIYSLDSGVNWTVLTGDSADFNFNEYGQQVLSDLNIEVPMHTGTPTRV